MPLDNFLVHHDGLTSYHMKLLSMGMHDRDVARLIKAVLRPGMRILDVGAHIGYFSLLCARLSGPDGLVWAFEPVPKIADLLQLNVEQNGYRERIYVVRMAVGSSVGKSTLYLSPADLMLSSLCREAAADCEPANLRTAGGTRTVNRLERIEVDCITLDAWAAQQSWPQVDVVKMDIEGAEIDALQGMRELKRRNPNLKLIVELNTRTIQAAGATVEAFWTALRECGFNKMSMPSPAITPVDFPGDWPKIRRTIRRMGNDRVNLLCETTIA